MPARDRMQHFDAYMTRRRIRCSRRSTWRAATTKPADKNDIFKILCRTTPRGSRRHGRARRSASSSRYEQTPTYEPERARDAACRERLPAMRRT